MCLGVLCHCLPPNLSRHRSPSRWFWVSGPLGACAELGELIPILGSGSGRGCSAGLGSFFIPRDFPVDAAALPGAGGSGTGWGKGVTLPCRSPGMWNLTQRLGWWYLEHAWDPSEEQHHPLESAGRWERRFQSLKLAPRRPALISMDPHPLRVAPSLLQRSLSVGLECGFWG